MNQFSVLLGALRYEFRMQFRRRAVWVTLCLIAVLMIGTYSRSSYLNEMLTWIFSHPLPYIVASWTTMMNILFPIGIGVLLADRLPRDRRTRVEEIFTSMPGALSSRLTGKFFGSMLATLIPVLIFYALGIGYIAYRTNELIAIPIALEVFSTVTLPGIIFITAFSIACPAIMWVPLYQFCFIGYWFWGNYLGVRQGIPTLSNTLLTPAGHYMATGFYGIESGVPGATPMQAVASILLLVSLAILVMFTLWLLLKWQQSRA